MRAYSQPKGLDYCCVSAGPNNFTIVTTTGLIPLEIFELARHFTVTKLVVTFVNVLIVWYLVARVRSH